MGLALQSANDVLGLAVYFKVAVLLFETLVLRGNCFYNVHVQE